MDEKTTTLYAQMRELAATAPEQTLFIEPTASDYQQVSRAAFLTRIDKIAALLAARGVEAGDCVATWLPNWSEAYAWQFAASAIGAHVIGINTRYNVAEVAHVLGRARPVVLALAHDFLHLDLLTRAREAILHSPALAAPTVVPLTGPGEPPVADTTGFDLGAGVWHPDDLQSFEPAEPDSNRLAVAFTTSGSTGLPKLAAHSEAAVIRHAQDTAERIGMDAQDVLIAALPFSGVFGFSASLCAIFAGSSLLLHPVFDEYRLATEIARFSGSHFVGADDMLSRLAAAWHEQSADLSSLAWFGVADFQGQSREIAAWAEREFGTSTVGVYGSSEVFALVAFWATDTDQARRWSGGGYPAGPAIEMRVADPVTDQVQPPGAAGELQFRGPNVVDEYLGDDGTQHAAAFTADGWFHTEDQGVACEDGGYVYQCRMGEVLRLRGFLVHPAEIEQRLAEHPQVAIAKVVSIKSAQSGEDTAVGFVTRAEADREIDGETLRTWCRDELARFKVPSVIHVIDQMPATTGTNGTKVKTVTLQTWAHEMAVDDGHRATR